MDDAMSYFPAFRELQTLEEYSTATALFDRLWNLAPNNDVSCLMTQLIGLIEKFEARNR